MHLCLLAALHTKVEPVFRMIDAVFVPLAGKSALAHWRFLLQLRSPYSCSGGISETTVSHGPKPCVRCISSWWSFFAESTPSAGTGPAMWRTGPLAWTRNSFHRFFVQISSFRLGVQGLVVWRFALCWVY